jgi:hypothetical protein
VDPASVVEALLDEEIARRQELETAGDPRAEAIAWRVAYLENLLTTLDQFPLTDERFVELLNASTAIPNPRFPDVPHASVDLLARWEAAR